MKVQPARGIAVWSFELAHLQVSAASLQEGESVRAVIAPMTYPPNKLCVAIRAGGEVIGFPPDFVEAGIISTVAQVVASQNLDGYVLRGQVALIKEGRIRIELGLIHTPQPE